MISDEDKHKIIGVAILIIEYWLGKTKLTKAGSIIELVLNVFKPKEIQMQITKGVTLELKGGKIVLEGEFPGGKISGEFNAGVVVNPVLDGFSAKIQSGEIDLIKGTDFEKEIVLKVIEYIKSQVNQ